MAKLGPPQIAQFARQAGFTGDALAIAVALAMAESSGDTKATHVNTDGSVDFGLWQINSVHKQYNPSRLLNEPLYNAQAAYGISGRGRSFTPWTTYNSGAYLKYFTPASALGNPTSGLGDPTLTPAPWWTFPRIDNLGEPDPFGGFPKPDSNIQIAANYPIHAILPGIVSGIDKRASWGASVTIRLDKPINSMATHTSYLHLGCNIPVNVGQHVSYGHVIAYNGLTSACGAQKVPLGFALYNGDNYGSGPEWLLMTKQNLTGNGPLNPVPIIESAKNGHIQAYGGGGGVNNYTDYFSSGSGHGNTPTYLPLLDQVHQTLITHQGFYGIALSVDQAEQFPGFIDLTQQQPDVQILGQDTGFSPPDFVGLARTFGATVTDNFIPFTIRGGLVLMGFILVLLLLVKLADPIVKAVAPIGMML